MRKKFRVSRKSLYSTGRTELVNLDEQIKQLRASITRNPDRVFAQEALHKVFQEMKDDRRK